MSKSLQTIDVALPVGSLDAYIFRVNQIPMLTAEEEHALAVDLYENNDLNAAKRLIMSHMRFVVKVARGYSGYGLALADLIQEGAIGLMKAVKRFDPYKGVRLVSFAVHWVKAEMHEFILRNWRVVKIATTKAQRKLFFNLRNHKKRLGWFTRDEVQTVADALGVSTDEVLNMEARLNARDAAFDGPHGSDHDDYLLSYSPSETIEDSRYEPSEQVSSKQLATQGHQGLMRAITTLDDRAQLILQRRWLADDEHKATLQELADEFGVSAERIRQLEKAAMNKLREQL